MIRIVQYVSDLMQKYQLQKAIRKDLGSLHEEEYSTTKEANDKITNLATLIREAEEFNNRTTTGPIDTESFMDGLYLSELRAEDAYFSGRLRVE